MTTPDSTGKQEGAAALGRGRGEVLAGNGREVGNALQAGDSLRVWVALWRCQLQPGVDDGFAALVVE